MSFSCKLHLDHEIKNIFNTLINSWWFTLSSQVNKKSQEMLPTTLYILLCFFILFFFKIKNSTPKAKNFSRWILFWHVTWRITKVNQTNTRKLYKIYCNEMPIRTNEKINKICWILDFIFIFWLDTFFFAVVALRFVKFYRGCDND